MDNLKTPTNIEQLAQILDMTEKDLRILADAAPRLYYRRPEPKKSGGVRIINAPFQRLKDIQRKILHRILDQVPIHKMLHSGPNTSAKTAAKAHVNQPVVIALDIKDFFPSIRASTICRTLTANGFSQPVAELLTRLLTHKARLPQGPPTSPSISRIVLCGVCKEIDALLRSISPYAKATIYVDDVTISGPIGLKGLIPTIISIFNRNGYSIKKSKTKPMAQNVEQVVLGIRVNRRLAPSSGFETKLEIGRATLHPNDPTLLGRESYKRYISRVD